MAVLRAHRAAAVQGQKKEIGALLFTAQECAWNAHFVNIRMPGEAWHPLFDIRMSGEAWHPLLEDDSGADMELNQTLNTLLVTLFQNILDIEEKALIVGEFSDITMNDMHVIEAIGMEEPSPSSAVAKRLSVTVGTLTKAIDRLTRNNYVIRERSEEDKRLVLLSLSEKGKRAYAHHQNFHREMIKAAVARFDENEMKMFAKSLGDLVDYFRDQNK